MTWDFKIQLQGLPGDQAAAKMIKHYDLPYTLQEFEKLNVESQKGKWTQAQFLPGVKELLLYLKKDKKMPIALCTSSNVSRFEGKTSHLKEIFNLFDVVITGDDKRIPKGRGKPYPDIWKVGLNQLNQLYNKTITPDHCLVFEDGVLGCQSGIRFGAYVIWVPHLKAYEHLPPPSEVLGEQGEVLKDLTEFNPNKFNLG
ncbi:uncharacterized protein SCODWIG_02567 [Saccharomycodes ludwigii]|uniref:Uncharacterized protein n=2 Tax=Saccharomycodes ludwigii TaxID=36035 RepID=A0A376B7Z5_9ASCO|nr:uncharacterized protein SCODWIG_02567 [Saccharomycodes ludwigii]